MKLFSHYNRWYRRVHGLVNYNSSTVEKAKRFPHLVFGLKIVTSLLLLFRPGFQFRHNAILHQKVVQDSWNPEDC